MSDSAPQSRRAGEAGGSGRSGRGNRSRRAFLGLAAGAAAGSAAAVAGVKIAGSRDRAKPGSLESAPVHPKAVAENSLPGDPDWPIRNVGAPNDMLGYVGQASIQQGQPVTLYASTTAREFTVSAFRIGWYGGDQARLLYTSPPVHGVSQAQPTVSDDTNTVSTNWGESVTLPTDDWPPGAYLLRMDADNGAQRYCPMTVISPSTAGKVVFKSPIPTWQAYNTWGGYDLYNGPAGAADYDNRSLVVSLDRPYDGDGAIMFLAHDFPIIRLAERLSIPLAYVSSGELDTNPDLLNGASALISMGHDEYWTPAERANVTAARDAGVNVAFMGANCCFRRIRLQNSPLGAQREVVCYKTSYTQDPMYGVNNAIVTNDWREPPDPNPESSMTGTYYESNPTNADYVVATPEAWMFAGTGVQKGSRFPGLIGIEYDRVNPDAPVERPIQVLSHSPLVCRDVNTYSDSAYYTAASGAGVFNSGTMRWVGCLSWNEYQEFGVTAAVGAFVRQVTTNILLAFADGPAAHKYPADDNLDQMQEWAGDPIASQHNLWPPTVL
jgi:hypothetical protein